MPHQTLRIIDANCNRISEGLRFLEDIARFLLNDAGLTRQLKTMRHDLIKDLSKLDVALLSERDSTSDVGANINRGQQQDLPSLVTANAKRVQEALRVVEELAKLPELRTVIHSKDFEQSRFKLYALEKELLSRILRHQKIARLTGLYVIIDSQALKQKDEVDAAGKAICGGANVIQFRDKHHSKSDALIIARKIKEFCQKANVLFIINDHLDIALAVDADGLHIGQDDLPLAVARRELPIDKIIGLSTRTLAQALEAEFSGADYVAIGSIYPSPTKPQATVVGLERLREIREAISIPIVAIGGINKENISTVMTAGADSVAVISAVTSQEDIETSTRELVREIEKETKSHQKPGNYH